MGLASLSWPAALLDAVRYERLGLLPTAAQRGQLLAA